MNLPKKVFKGFSWLSLGNVLTQILKTLTYIYLVRLLDPNDFGLFALATTFIGILTIFTQLGIPQAIIHFRELDNADLNTIFYLGLIQSAVAALILCFFSSNIASLFNEPNLNSLLKLVSVIFVLSSINVFQQSILQRDLNFRPIVVRDIIAQIISSIFAIILSKFGFGVYSLVYSLLILNLSKTILIWRYSYWAPTIKVSFKKINSIYKYVRSSLGFSVINAFARNSDNLLIGKYIGSEALGPYSVAYSIMLNPLNNITHLIFKILFPTLSIVKNNKEKFKSIYLKATTCVCLVTIPLMLFIFSVSELAVEVLFNNRWSELGFLIRVLSLVGLIQSIVSTVGNIYLALGTTDLLLKMGIFNTTICVLSFILGLRFGTQGVAISYLIANLVSLRFNLFFAWRQIKLNIKEFIKNIDFIIISSLLMFIILEIFRFKNFFGIFKSSDINLFIFYIFFSLLIYISSLILIYPKKTTLLIRNLKSMK